MHNTLRLVSEMRRHAKLGSIGYDRIFHDASDF